VNRDLIYSDYYYRSGTSGTMTQALRDVVRMVEQYVDLGEGDRVLDIGANDGTLLSFYPARVHRVGVDPASMMAANCINEYFSIEAMRRYGQAARYKAITSVACFYDLEYPLQAMRDVADLLAPDGVWINQMNDIASVIENNALDFFSHEHLTHWWTKPLEIGLEMVGLQLFRVDNLQLNGGTVRFYICREGERSVEYSVLELRESQQRTPMLATLKRFGQRAEQVKTSLNSLLKRLKGEGKKVFVYGASTRGNTLLQYCGLDVALLPCALDRDPNKWGRVMVGTNIPIVSEEDGRHETPDYLLVLPYSYLSEFQIREQEFLAQGGRFIVPLPQPRII
jgi:hypothetical protein